MIMMREAVTQQQQEERMESDFKTDSSVAQVIKLLRH